MAMHTLENQCPVSEDDDHDGDDDIQTLRPERYSVGDMSGVRIEKTELLTS